MTHAASGPTVYTPGRWFGIVGPAATVLLPPTEKARAGALWAVVDDGAGFDDVLDTLVADGLRAVPGFVLVASEGETTKVIVRGASVAAFETDDGPVEVDGGSSSIWAERTLTGVTRMSISVEESDGPSYQFTGGLARVAGIASPPEPEPEPAAVVAPEPEDAAEPVGAVDDSTESEAGPALAAAGGAAFAGFAAGRFDEDHHEPEPSDPLSGPLRDIAAAESDELEAQAPFAPEPAEPDAGPHEPPPTEPFSLAAPPAPTVPPPPPAPGWGPPPPSAPPADSDHDGLTFFGAPAEETSAAVARLEFSSGEIVEVDRVVIIGRSPEAGRSSQPGQEHVLISVPSPNQEISSTHCEVRPGTGGDHGAAVVTDLGSTNGTVLVQPGLGPEELRPGAPVVLTPGSVIDLGEGLTIRVAAP